MKSECYEQAPGLMPLVSVVIPAYNAESFIRETLDSVLEQTYRNIEVIVVDDGSHDRTAEIVADYAQRDRRIILLQQTNQGVAAARNLAIELAKGEFIAPVDADDVWYPQKLEKQVQCLLEADDSTGLVYTWSVDIDDQGNLTGGYHARSLEGNALIALTYTNFLGHASVPLIRRCCFTKVGDYDSQLRVQNAEGCEDIDLYLRIAEHYQFQVIPEFLMAYRRTTGSMSCNWGKMLKSHLLVREKVKQKYSQIPKFVYQWARSNYYLYILYHCYRSNNYCGVLKWFWTLLLSDPVITMDFKFLKLIVLSFLRSGLYPLNAKLATQFSSYQSWLIFIKKLMPTKKQWTIDEVEKRMKWQTQDNLAWWQFRDRLLKQRWKTVEALSQKTILTLDSASQPPQMPTQLKERIL